MIEKFGVAINLRMKVARATESKVEEVSPASVTENVTSIYKCHKLHVDCTLSAGVGIGTV
jgi:hypothetical protein